MQELRLILYPFSILYDGMTSLRNWAFDRGILKQKMFDIPIIAVGNLSTGGTGKTPMIEYLIHQLAGKNIGVLSRGYGRDSHGYLEVSEESLSSKVGDEPLQIKRKFQDLIVSAVCEKRVEGIESLRKGHQLDVILLDDAYQHRYVKASHYILLTSYGQLYVNDYVLPAGNLRESRRGAGRARTIIVTKCPSSISMMERHSIKMQLNLLPQQNLYFSCIGYGEVLQGLDRTIHLNELKGKQVTVVTGIANPEPYLEYLRSQVEVLHLKYKDHHVFTNNEVETIRNKHIVITTEKDFIRLKEYGLLNVFYCPIKTIFLDNDLVL
jgi:tetraacyldisaccharide 4'-kinase